MPKIFLSRASYFLPSLYFAISRKFSRIFHFAQKYPVYITLQGGNLETYKMSYSKQPPPLPPKAYGESEKKDTFFYFLIFFHFCLKKKENNFFFCKKFGEKMEFFCNRLPLLEVLFFQFTPLNSKKNKHLSQFFHFFSSYFNFLLEKKIAFFPKKFLQKKNYFLFPSGKSEKK